MKFGVKGVNGGLDLCHFPAKKVAWVQKCGFYATVRCRLRHYTKAAVEGDQNQIHAGTKNGLQALIKAKQRKEASGKSVSQSKRAQMGTPTSPSTS